MSPILVATIAGLLTAFFWGTSDWLASKSAKRLSPFQVDFVITIIGLGWAALILLFGDFTRPTNSQILTIIAASSLITMSYWLFVKALSDGAVGVIVPLANSYPLVTVLLSAVFLNQIFSAGQFAAIAGILAGALILAYEKNHKKIPAKEFHRDTMFAAGAALCWGLGFFVLNTISGEISWQSQVTVNYLYAFVFSGTVMLLMYRHKIVQKTRQALAYRPAVITALCGSLGGITLYVGADYADSILIPTVLSAGGPLVASLYGAVFDDEKLGAIKRVGAVLVVAGVIILNLA